MKRNIVVKFTVDGFHYWKDAPPERAYLANKHRHLFHIQVQLEVFHQDREVEFHDLLDFCKSQVQPGDFGGRSCEMIAEELTVKLKDRYNRKTIVSVFEDNEVGAVVTS